MRPTHTITLELDSADLFYLAKLVKRDTEKRERQANRPEQLMRRAELLEAGRGDMAAIMIAKHRRLWEQLYERAIALRAAEGYD